MFSLLEVLLETSSNSTIERSILNVLRKHFLEQRSITWKPTKVELIVNTQLTDDFFCKYLMYNAKFIFPIDLFCLNKYENGKYTVVSNYFSFYFLKNYLTRDLYIYMFILFLSSS